ncbi:MAG: 23S rRNA (adenine(2503)-C(2))-methyltransferase RlmN [Acidobacteriota bacterium]
MSPIKTIDKKDIRGLTLDELKAELAAMGEKSFRAVQIFDWLYRRDAADFAGFITLPKALRDKLAARFSLGRLELETRLDAGDGTAKLLFKLADGHAIETVLIPSGRRTTACLSTQVGCKFACAFCASGLKGFKRNLSPAEIAGQALYVTKTLGADVTNYVFMGMGEPLDNFDNLVRAVRIMNAPQGMGIAARRMTISTAGFVPGIERLKGLDLQINLSISLHAVTDLLRSRLMPINKAYPLEKLVAAGEDYIRSGGRMITLEYILIRGLNTSPHCADGLAGIARRLRAKVNLIVYSPVVGLPFETPSDVEVDHFRRWLEERKVRVTLRLSKGKEILAACGQLAGRFLAS